MFTLAHISDIHLSPLPRVRPQDLLNKRITGYLNWKINRAKHMHRDTLSDLITHMRAQRPHFTAITGDLVNLSLDKEFENAAKWIEKLGPSATVCTIPGNHDAYVPGALGTFQKSMGAYASGELLDNTPYPFVRRVGDVAIIGCSSAVATPPFYATGLFDQPQAERLEECLTLMGDAGFFRTVMIHHPPTEELAHPRKGLVGAALFRDVIAKTGAELILHGHTHRANIGACQGPTGEVPVVGVAAASADASSGEDPARYNLFSIARAGEAWSCTLREFGYQRIGDDIVLRLQMRIH